MGFVYGATLPTSSFAQLAFRIDNTTRFDNLGVAQGLSSRYVTCIHQDKYGFVWIGTQNGLNLYDGMDFTIFRSQDNNPNSLPDNFIYKIVEDKDSTLWICSEFGLSRYNRATEDFTNFYPDTSDHYNPVNGIREIYAWDNYLMLNAGGTLYKFNTKTETFQDLKIDLLPQTSDVLPPVSIYPDTSGFLWAFSHDGHNLLLYRYNYKLGDLKKYTSTIADSININRLNITTVFKVQPDILWLGTFGYGMYKLKINDEGSFSYDQYTRYPPTGLISNYINQIYQDRKSNLWAGGKNGFFKLIEGGNSLPLVDDPENTFFIKYYGARDFSEDNQGRFWMVTRDGMFRYNFQNKALKYFMHDAQDPTSLSGNHPNMSFTDHSDQTWIISGNSGISRLNTHANAFLQNSKNDKENSLSDNRVSSFLVDSRGSLWVGTLGGGLNRTVYRQDHLFDDFRQYLKPEAPGKPRYSYYSFSDISVLYEDKEGTVWIGTYDGLGKYKPETDFIDGYAYNFNPHADVGDNAVTAIFEDHLGTFWVGTKLGLNIFDRESEKFIHYTHDPDDSTSLGANSIQAIYEDSQYNVWFGGKYLKKLVRKDTSFITYKPDPREPKSINDENIRAILEDNNNHLWLGTNKGLDRMNILDGTFTAITDSNGRQQEAISGMCMDDHGNIWISKAFGGLTKFNPVTGKFKDFNTGDGLIANEFAEGSAYKDKNGWMYFGGFKGFNVFHPDSIKDNTYVPPVYITGFYVFDKKKHFGKPLSDLQSIDLKHDENEFSFDFVALNYLNSAKNKYAYMLEGYDKGWNYTDDRRFARYTNMGPGHYTFRVKASNNDGYWNEQGASLGVIIHQPYWATIWAVLFYIFIFGWIIYLLRRYELNRLHYKQNLEINLIESEKHAELDIEKNKFYSNISHEFRTPLTLILGPLEKVIGRLKNEEEKEELNLVKRNARRLQTLINQLLSLSKLESGTMKLNARPVNIVKLTKLYLQSFHSLAENKGISLEFESDADEYIVYLDAIKYEKIANNLLSNAFKFTERGGKIKVRITPIAEPTFSPPPGETQRGENLTTPIEKGAVLIKVSDTGIGIKREKMTRIFDRFYQVDENQSKPSVGSGIGLALTKELVELHHGTITAESELGIGTSFTIVFPAGKDHLNIDEVFEPITDDEEFEDKLFDEEYQNIREDEIKTETPIDDTLPLVLIVEDNTDMRTYIKSYMAGTYNIIEAANGKDGAAKAIEHVPDLIVSDLMMPIVDGNEMTMLLKGDERTSHIPIILLTAKASKESKLEGLELGADDFLTKPFDTDELLVRIKNLIEQRKRLSQMLSKHIGDPAQTELIQQSSGKLNTKLDEQFLEKATDVIRTQMSNPEFSVEMLAGEMAMSRVQLHRKLKSLTDHSASDLIREVRLIKAAELLKQGELNVTEVSYEIGISSLSNFAKVFKEKYGVTPSEFK